MTRGAHSFAEGTVADHSVPRECGTRREVRVRASSEFPICASAAGNGAPHREPRSGVGIPAARI